MTRSLNQIIYELIELYRANYKVTDTLDERLVASWIQSIRALLLSAYKDTSSIDPHVVQILPNLRTELVPGMTIPFLDNKSTVLKTVDKIPSFIINKFGIPLIVRIYSNKFISYPFTIVTKNAAVYSGSGKFNTNSIYTFLHDDYIYLTSKSGIHKNIDYINVEGVFNNPIEAYEFVNGPDTYDWNYEYPISENLILQLADAIVKSKFNFILYPIQDNTNDANNNLSTNQNVLGKETK